MGSTEPLDDRNTDPSVKEVVQAVSLLGERAQKLATDLAVAVARLKQERRDRGPFSDDILDLVARVTRLTQSVNDAVAAIEKGLPQTRTSSTGLWKSSREVGIPDEATLERLTRWFEEALQMAARVFEVVRAEIASAPGALPGPIDINRTDTSWSDESPGPQVR